MANMLYLPFQRRSNVERKMWNDGSWIFYGNPSLNNIFTKYIFKMFTQKYERTNESIKLIKVENVKEILTITDLYCFVPL